MKTVEELFEAIDKLPDTIESVQVPTDFLHFNPSRVKVIPRLSGNEWREKLKSVITDTLKKPGGDEVDEFILKSYYGGEGEKDPYYIQLNSEGSRDFAEAMGSGKYGALD